MTSNARSAPGANPAVQPSILLAPPRRSFLSGFLRWEWFLVVLIAVVVLINTRLSPYFLNVDNLFRASSDFMEMGLMMLPMVLIIITGNVDLAVASTLGMSASLWVCCSTSAGTSGLRRGRRCCWG